MTHTYCPDCGCVHLNIVALVFAHVTFDATGGHEVQECPVDGVEFDESSNTVCRECGYRQTLDKFAHDEAYVGSFGKEEE